MNAEQLEISNPDVHPDSTAETRERGERLKRLRNLANLNRKELCDWQGLNVNTLKGWEIGRYGGLTVKGAEKIVQRVAQEGVHCTLDWLMYDIGSGPSIVTDYHRIKEAPPEHDYTATSFTDEDKNIAEELMLFRKHYKHTMDFIVTDDGMAPQYQKGDYIAGVKRTGQRISDAIGQNCIVQTAAGHILLRNVRKGSKEGLYNLICLNINSAVAQPVIYDVKLVSCAPAIWKRSKNL